MATQRKRLTRREALGGMGGLALAAQTAGTAPAQQPGRPPEEAVPITGKAGPGLEPFDAAMRKIMDHHGVPGAALAIAKNGRLVLAKGYGWANVGSGEPVQPDTLFGLASLSKPITAIAILKLVEQGKLGLDVGVFDILKHIKPPRSAASIRASAASPSATVSTTPAAGTGRSPATASTGNRRSAGPTASPRRCPYASSSPSRSACPSTSIRGPTPSIPTSVT